MGSNPIPLIFNEKDSREENRDNIVNSELKSNIKGRTENKPKRVYVLNEFDSKSVYKEEEFDFKQLYINHRKKFELSMLERCSQTYVRTIMSYLDKVFEYEFYSIMQLKKLIETGKISKKYSGISFRKFVNYCEENDLMPLDLIHRAKTKIKATCKSNIDSYVPVKKEIERSLKLIEREDFNLLYQLLIQSGARFTEVKYLFCNLDETKVEYNGNIAIYNNFYLRGKKTSYYLFFQKETFDKFVKYKELFNRKYFERFRDVIQENKQIVNTKYLRKYNFTLMIKKGIDFEIANFIQGRVSQNIGFNHYLAKKEIALREYSKILK